MPTFLGITPAKSLRSAPGADAPQADSRSAADPATGRAFRSELNAANERSGTTGRSERRARPAGDASPQPNDAATNGPQDATPRSNEAPARTADSAIGSDREAAASAADDDRAAPSADESQAEAAPSADALAMLLNWLVPVAPPKSDTPAGTSLMGTAEMPKVMVQPGALTADAADTAATANAPGIFTAAPDPASFMAAGFEVPMATATAAPTTSVAASAVPTTETSVATGTVTTGQVELPEGMTPIPAGPALNLRPQTGTSPTTTSDQSLLATMQAAAQARAAAAATATDGPSAQVAASQTPDADAASLAANFGAQIVSATGPGAGRAGGPATPLAEDARPAPAGSTAQAAGAVSATAVQLPGQAVAAASAVGQDTGATLAEAMAATPEASAVKQGVPEAPTDFQALFATTGTQNATPAQATASVQGSAAAAPPIATQIVDGAMLASRRIGQSVEMILQPEGLGAVTLKVTLERGGLGVHMSLDNPQAREMVQASWPQLQQALEQRGLSVQSMMLDLSNGQSGQGFQAFQQFNGQQQFSGHQARGGTGNGDRRDGSTLAAVEETPRVQASAGTSARVDYRI